MPGHWEGDLIIGRAGWSAIGTLVERSTRYCLLLHLPGKHNAEAVRDAMLAKITELPQHLWRSLTWDQGWEMAKHGEITIASGLPIYFCDPHSPWQRGSNENTNGLLRQYFPKGSDLSVHSVEHLDYVAAELNGRPRKTLGGRTPAEALNELLSNPYQPTVATTAYRTPQNSCTRPIGERAYVAAIPSRPVPLSGVNPVTVPIFVSDPSLPTLNSSITPAAVASW